MAGKLTAVQVKNLTTPGRFQDGNGLMLVVAAGGSKSWIQRVSIDGKRRDIGLGGYPAVSLSDARTATAKNKLAVQDGQDITKASTVAGMTPTVGEAIETVYTLFCQKSKSEQSRSNRRLWADRYILPAIGSIPVDKLRIHHVKEMLAPIWTTKHVTADKVRSMVYDAMRWAKVSEYTTGDNPADIAHFKVVLPQAPKGGHHRALPYQDVATAITTVDTSPSGPDVKLAFRFLVLTAVRTVEIRLATWSEIDWENRVWSIPADKMKMERPHRVPLSTVAMEVLRQAWTLRQPDNDYIFHGMKAGSPLTPKAILNRLEDSGIPATGHGFRSSFRDWAEENSNASWAVAEYCLAHQPGTATERSYQRSDLLERRRPLMQAWSDYLSTGETATTREIDTST